MIATGEHMLLHVDRGVGATAPAGAEILAALDGITDAQRELAWPEAAGARVRGPVPPIFL